MDIRKKYEKDICNIYTFFVLCACTTGQKNEIVVCGDDKYGLSM